MSSRLELLHAYHDGELGPLRRWQVRRWLARDEDDGQLERELYPQDVATEEYVPCEYPGCLLNLLLLLSEM